MDQRHSFGALVGGLINGLSSEALLSTTVQLGVENSSKSELMRDNNSLGPKLKPQNPTPDVPPTTSMSLLEEQTESSINHTNAPWQIQRTPNGSGGRNESPRTLFTTDGGRGTALLLLQGNQFTISEIR